MFTPYIQLINNIIALILKGWEYATNKDVRYLKARRKLLLEQNEQAMREGDVATMQATRAEIANIDNQLRSTK
jgi:hypothetical protein